jgi:tetracycline repressor-like protein
MSCGPCDPAKASMVDLAWTIRVSQGSVYRDFPSKAALVDAVVERWQARVSQPFAGRVCLRAPGLILSSDNQIQAMRQMPMWKGVKKLAPTLVYDSEVLGEGHSLPAALLSRVRTPALVMHGGAGSPAMGEAVLGDQRSHSHGGTSDSRPPDSWCQPEGPRTGTGRVLRMTTKVVPGQVAGEGGLEPPIS